MKKLFIKSVCCTLLFFISKLITAQSFIYTNYSTADGLSSSEVYDITQDKNGYLWFATDRGLTRYDGYEFKKYTTNDGIDDLVILNFYEQNDGTILCITLNRKLFFINPDTDSFTSYKYNRVLKQITDYNAIINITKKEDSLYINLATSLGYLKINQEGIIENKLISCIKDLDMSNKNIDASYIKHPKQGFSASLSFDKIKKKYEKNCHIYLDRPFEDYFIFIDRKEMYVLNTTTDFLKRIVNDNITVVTGTYDSNHFWIGLNHGGGKVFSKDGKLKYHFFPNKTVTKFFVDHEGGLWIGTTDSGVYYIKNKYIGSHAISTSCKDVTSLTKNKKNQLYVAYSNGEVYKQKNYQYKKLWESKNKHPVKIQYNQKVKKLFIDTYNFSYQEEVNSIQKINSHKYFVSRAISDNPNRLPVLTNRIIDDTINVQILPHTYTKKINRILDIEYANEGYFFGTLSGGYHYKKDSLYALKEIDSHFKVRIEDIDKVDKRYYFASLGNGVIVMDKDSTFTIKESDGLSSDIITEIYPKNNKEVFVTSNTGLNKITFSNDLKNYTVSKLSIDEGLPSNHINDVEVINDTIWIATKKGLFSYPEKKMDLKQETISRDWLKIESVTINNKFENQLNKISALNYNENTLEIKFSAISFKKNKDVLYRYRLVGLENNWNITQNKSVKYNHLTAGKYTFEIQTKGGNIVWNTKSTTLTFKIHLPFWKTWWFNTLILIAISVIIYMFFKFKILSYDKELFKELLFLVLKKLNGKSQHIIIKESGIEIKLDTSLIHYAKSAGNYLEIVTLEKTYVVRKKMGDFEKNLPDKENFIRVHRSYIIRKDKIESKNTKWVKVNGEQIPVSRNNKEKIDKMVFY
ncbi:ligand-binding sensor domain-containing protein [Tenacibaculum jejuense]|uniref:Probable hybrid two-component system sensor histidine kinase and response regulator receiver n=1 Tax=Tenacibaculum jejuense TaxID=584609 RepID=A0A238U9J1_9FLAO|nr:LytTR family transcriptional regulator DNA-binding domain-containing protein [Tenacibaculum jejuense]SNR15851.1 Probable hybrid two-component system sensor histidine kinase and response regulator receiver [Tenacibaculum jejuense]